MKRMSLLKRQTLIIILACVFAISARSADEAKHIVPKCSTQIDPDDEKLILMVCDFSNISVAELVVDASADIVLLDGTGTSQGTQTLHFADKKNPMRGGRKYARSFEYTTVSKSSTVQRVRISSAEAVVVPEISALGR